MSTLKVEILTIDDILPHPNADRLELVQVKGWNCVVQKGRFVKGDVCVYIPIDSILPKELEDKLFPPESKVRLSKSRVKTIKLRGAISQGLVVKPGEVNITGRCRVGDDIREMLGITKYEPPVHFSPQTRGGVSRKQPNPHFHKYTDIENFKNYPDVFIPGEFIVATEKIHGSNFRCGWVPFNADTVWKKIKQFFGLAKKYEFVYGSHNVQLQNKLTYSGAYSNECGNVYWETVKKYDLKNKLKPGEVLYGEIYGDGIQKGYMYDCEPGEIKLVVFDINKNGFYLDFWLLYETCNELGLPSAPVVYFGTYGGVDKLKVFAEGDSLLAPKQKIREGIVIRPFDEDHTYMGRKILKLVNDEYLLQNNTEFH